MATPCRDARAAMTRATSSLKICVQDRRVVPRKSPHIDGILRPISSTGAWDPALGEEEERPRVFLEIVFRRESTAFTASGDIAIKHCVRYFGMHSVEEEALFDMRGQGGFCQCLAYLLHMLFFPSNVYIWA